MPAAELPKLLADCATLKHAYNTSPSDEDRPDVCRNFLLKLVTYLKINHIDAMQSHCMRTEINMAVERTLSIVKPDAVARNLIGEIYSRFEKSGLRIVAAKMLSLSEEQAQGFYAEHDGKPFFADLCAYMRSGPVMVQVLEGEDAVATNRRLMGATNPSEAEPGTIRADFAESIDANSVHGSDAVESAAREIAFFFSTDEVHNR